MFVSHYFVLSISVLLVSENKFELKKCGRIPHSVDSSAVIYDGEDSIYVLGGRFCSRGEGDFQYGSNAVLKYNIETGSSQVVGQFPHPVATGVAAMDSNGDIFYIGGEALTIEIGLFVDYEYTFHVTDDIYKISKHNPQPVLMGKHLNGPKRGHAGITIGNSVFLFGGGDHCTNGCNPGVLPIEELNLSTLESTFVTNFTNYRDFSSVVYDGENIYIFGSAHNRPSTSHRFNPITHKLQKLDNIQTDLPILSSGAALVDKVAYIIGGGGEEISSILTFNIEDEAMNEVEINFKAHGFGGTSAVYVPKKNRIYIFGIGEDRYGHAFKDIYCIDL